MHRDFEQLRLEFPELGPYFPRPSRVSLESLRLENMAQVPEYRAEVGQIHDARTPVSATL